MRKRWWLAASVLGVLCAALAAVPAGAGYTYYAGDVEADDDVTGFVITAWDREPFTLDGESAEADMLIIQYTGEEYEAELPDEVTDASMSEYADAAWHWAEENRGYGDLVLAKVAAWDHLMCSYDGVIGVDDTTDNGFVDYQSWLYPGEVNGQVKRLYRIEERPLTYYIKYYCDGTEDEHNAIRVEWIWDEAEATAADKHSAENSLEQIGDVTAEAEATAADETSAENGSELAGAITETATESATDSAAEFASEEVTEPATEPETEPDYVKYSVAASDAAYAANTGDGQGSGHWRVSRFYADTVRDYYEMEVAARFGFYDYSSGFEANTHSGTLNIREYPNGPIITSLPKGTDLTVERCEQLADNDLMFTLVGKFTEKDADGTSKLEYYGWVATEYLGELEDRTWVPAE